MDAVESSKFITQSKSDVLVEKISTLTSQHRAQELNRNISVEGRIKPGNEKIYLIIEAINEAINKKKLIVGTLIAFNEDSIIVEINGENLEIERKKISKATKFINF